MTLKIVNAKIFTVYIKLKVFIIYKAEREKKMKKNKENKVKNEEKNQKKSYTHSTNLVGRIIALVLAGMMLISACATIIFYIVQA